jgi:hypothetical protein
VSSSNWNRRRFAGGARVRFDAASGKAEKL